MARMGTDSEHRSTGVIRLVLPILTTVLISGVGGAAAGMTSYFTSLRTMDAQVVASRETLRREVATTYATKEETEFIREMLKEIRDDVKDLVNAQPTNRRR